MCFYFYKRPKEQNYEFIRVVKNDFDAASFVLGVVNFNLILFICG